jgi:hypothetical protein
MTTSTSSSKAAPERKRLQTLALHTTFIAVLISMWPGLDAFYAYGLEASGDTLFGQLSSTLQVEYRWIPPTERKDDGELEMMGFVTWQSEPVWTSHYSVRDRGYTPTAVLIGLMLATPGSRRRHIAGTCLAVITLNAFYLLQTALLAASLFASVETNLIVLGPTLARSHDLIMNLFGSPIPRYAAVFATWALFAAPASGIDLSGNRLPLGRLFRSHRAP